MLTLSFICLFAIVPMVALF